MELQSKGRWDRSGEQSVQSFWEATGREFPNLADAPSTEYYFECERELFKTYFPVLRDKTVIKTDLWDEAKNSRILRWAAQQGAEVYAIDISLPILRGAVAAFRSDGQNTQSKFIISDVRKIGFADNTFDYLYSMGTVEHSPQYRMAIEECFRVLKRGGRAIIGVPNKLDPFLRPLFVNALYYLGLYGYGYELSFSKREFNRILEEVGFRIVDNSGILFMPGMLRMADLYFNFRMPWATRITGPMVAPFAYLYRRFPRLRRHGYLIAVVVEKP